MCGFLTSDGSTVEVLSAPSGAVEGERITFAGFASDDVLCEKAPNDKALKAISAEMRVDEAGVAKYKDVPFTTSAGVVTLESVRDALIKTQLK